MKKELQLLIFAAALPIASCAGSDLPTAPSAPAPSLAGGVALTTVFPQGGTTGVPVATDLRIGFGGPMAPGMEQYVDLHHGGVADVPIPMPCTWSGDRTTLVCHPTDPLHAGTRYTLHVGGGLRDANGHPIGLGTHGPMAGGQWVDGSAMSAFHGGAMAWGMMGAGWRHADGSYGLGFSFTTAQ